MEQVFHTITINQNSNTFLNIILIYKSYNFKGGCQSKLDNHKNKFKPYDGKSHRAFALAKIKEVEVKMKRIIAIFSIIAVMFSRNTYAFDIVDIKPDDSFVQSYGRDISADIAYLQGIADSYRDKYIVTKEQFINCSSIDGFYSQLLKSLAIEELDNGKVNFNFDNVYMSKEYRDKLKQLKVLGGLSGYKAEFEPTAFFRIHRNISLIGGYVNYTKTYENPDDAYWQYICSVEEMTKEVVPYETRLKLLEKIRELNSFIVNDRSFKIFLLVDGNIDGLYLKD